MTFDVYEQNFRQNAQEAGFSEEDVQKCLAYARPLVEQGVPVIYNTANLSAFVGYTKTYLKKSALYTNSYYRTFTIKKKNGKLRTLNEPLPSLKEIQIWILTNILYKIPINRFAKAYIPGRNILDNVRFHRNKEKIVSLDIENFFPSITRPKVEGIFRALGYSSNVANLLSKLCCCNEVLPQGAPTSPYLSNLYLRDFDKSISIYSVEKRIKYTRYADDLIFSGEFDESELISFVEKKLIGFDLRLNKKKIKVMGQDDRQIVTGIVVNKVLQIPKNQRLQIRQEVYYIKKFGLAEHMKAKNYQQTNYIRHLLGKINYALFINPNDKEILGYKTYLYDHYLTFII